nr:MAG TPA: hypothetical protein [Bacteriophage sp.]
MLLRIHSESFQDSDDVLQCRVHLPDIFCFLRYVSSDDLPVLWHMHVSYEDQLLRISGGNHLLPSDSLQHSSFR